MVPNASASPKHLLVNTPAAGLLASDPLQGALWAWLEALLIPFLSSASPFPVAVGMADSSSGCICVAQAGHSKADTIPLDISVGECLEVGAWRIAMSVQ